MTVTPDDDTRGIVRPDRLGDAFTLERISADPPLDRVVDRFWMASWHLPEDVVYEQKIIDHPVVNLVFQNGHASYSGISRETTVIPLAGSGRAIGIKFRAGGFRPFLGRPMHSIADQTFGIESLFGPAGRRLAQEVDEADFSNAVSIIHRFLEPRLPEQPTLGEEVSAIVELITADPAVVSVSALAERLGTSPRRLQRLFADQVGVSPSWVIRRARLHAAAEAAKRSSHRSWGELAASLGFSDQAHLTRRFRETIGEPPARYSARIGSHSTD